MNNSNQIVGHQKFYTTEGKIDLNEFICLDCGTISCDCHKHHPSLIDRDTSREYKDFLDYKKSLEEDKRKVEDLERQMIDWDDEMEKTMEFWAVCSLDDAVRFGDLEYDSSHFTGLYD